MKQLLDGRHREAKIRLHRRLHDYRVTNHVDISFHSASAVSQEVDPTTTQPAPTTVEAPLAMSNAAACPPRCSDWQNLARNEEGGNGGHLHCRYGPFLVDPGPESGTRHLGLVYSRRIFMGDRTVESENGFSHYGPQETST